MALAQNWWAVVLRGLAAGIFGVITLFRPNLGLAALLGLFGVYALFIGALALISAFWVMDHHDHWGFLLFEGIIATAAGIATFIWPALTALGLLNLIAFWAIFTGIAQISSAVRWRGTPLGGWGIGIGGGFSLLFGLLLVAFPGTGVLSILWLIGVYALLFGILNIGMGIQLRNLGQPTSPSLRKARA